MTRRWLPDLWLGLLAALAYLLLRLLISPLWEPSVGWPDVVLSIVLGCAAVAARWMHEH